MKIWQRLLTVCLLVVIMCSFTLVPLNVQAYTAFDPASAAVWAWLQASGFITDTAEAGASVIAEIINFISKQAANGMPAFIALSNVMNNVTGNGLTRLTEEDRAALSYTLFTLLKSSMNFANGLKHKSVDLNNESLTQQQIPIISAGVQMYVPTEAAMQDIMSITQMQVLYEGFIDQQVELSKETNSILNKIRIFLGTIDLNMKAEIANSTASIQRFMNVMNNNLMTYITNVEREVYNLRTSLTGRLDNLTEFLDTKLNSVITVSNAINSNMMTYVSKVTQAVDNVRSSVTYRIDNVKNAVESLPQDISVALKGQFTSLQQSLNQLLDVFPALQQSLDQILEKIPAYEEIEITDKQPVFDEALGELGFAEDQLIDKSDDGKKYVPVYIGRAKELLEQYKTALLAIGAILSKFLNLPIIGDLVQFSLALGIFALIVNLANTSISKSNDNSVKGKKTLMKGG